MPLLFLPLAPGYFIALLIGTGVVGLGGGYLYFSSEYPRPTPPTVLGPAYTPEPVRIPRRGTVEVIPVPPDPVDPGDTDGGTDTDMPAILPEYI